MVNQLEPAAVAEYPVIAEIEKDLVEMFGKRVIAIDEGVVVSDGMEGYYSNENQ